MNIHNRLEDLTTVFDKTWKANHNDDVKEARKKEKQFINKMFNTKSPINDNKPKILTPGERASNLQNHMNNVNNFNNNIKLNNIKGKFN